MLTKITAGDGRERWIDPLTVIMIDEVRDGSLILLVKDGVQRSVPSKMSPSEVAQRVVAAMMFGTSVEQCPADASTLGDSRPCRYPEGHTGPHSWEEE